MKQVPRGRLVLTALALLSCGLGLVAEASPPAHLVRERLSNGLEVFILPDPAVPLARVQIAFRAGADSQTPDTAGLFHLLEHVLWQGSALEPGPAARAELARMGAAEWNGGTSAESTDFWLSLPAENAKEGMAWWSSLFSPASLDPAVVEAEKAVVAREIVDRAADPGIIYESALLKRLFSKYPWRRDPAGSPAAVAAATPESLNKLRDTWFGPGNAALFVGGDVDPALVIEWARELFGSWPAGPNPWAKPPPAQPKLGISRPTWLLFSDPSLPTGQAIVEARYRGPDLATDPAGAATGELWTWLSADPAGRFKTTLAKNIPGLAGPDPIFAWYVPRKQGGIISISAFLTLDAKRSTLDRVRAFKEQVRGVELTAMKANPSYFSAEAYAQARLRAADARTLALETTDGYLEQIASFWGSAAADWFLELPGLLEKTGQKELFAFLDAYVMKNLEVIALRMNPVDVEREGKSLLEGGFERIGPENAFWWKK